MESFFLAETTKYLYLIFDPDNWIHNTGSSGHTLSVNGRQCVVEAGGYVFNSGKASCLVAISVLISAIIYYLLNTYLLYTLNFTFFTFMNRFLLISIAKAYLTCTHCSVLCLLGIHF